MNYKKLEACLGFKSYIEVDKLMIKYEESGQYDNLQLSQIRNGIESGLDVSKYANPTIPANMMMNYRHKLLRKR